MASSSNNRAAVPEANEVGVSLKEGYNGDLSAKDAGRIGGNMVKKMIQQAESQLSK